MPRREFREIFFRQLEKLHRRAQTPAVFRVGRMFEILLEMHERAGRLDQSLEKIIVARVIV